MWIRRLAVFAGAGALVGSVWATAPAQQPAATATVPPAPSAPTPSPAPSPAPPEPQTAATPAPAQEPAQPVTAGLSQAQLDQLLAPIALYPDPLLSQVLMASTYPGEVVSAARWLDNRANRRLRGPALVNAVKRKGWDASIMALVPFSGVLDAMAGKIEWTEQLGNAFLAQQADVMASVQRLRHQAMEAGTLKTSAECRCVIETKGELIAIRPTTPDVVYVPFCDPPRVYGAWRYPDYPPVILPPPVGVVFVPGAFVVFEGVVLSGYGPLWGWSSLDWGRSVVTVEPFGLAALAGAGAAIAGGVWLHDPAHRRGFLYGDPAVQTRFDKPRVAALGASVRREPTASRRYSGGGYGPGAAYGKAYHHGRGKPVTAGFTSSYRGNGHHVGHDMKPHKGDKGGGKHGKGKD